MKKSNLLYDVCNQNEIPNAQIKKTFSCFAELMKDLKYRKI